MACESFRKWCYPGGHGRKVPASGLRHKKIGPAAQVGKGMPEMSLTIERLEAQDRSACPFATAKSSRG